MLVIYITGLRNVVYYDSTAVHQLHTHGHAYKCAFDAETQCSFFTIVWYTVKLLHHKKVLTLNLHDLFNLLASSATN